MKICVSQVLKQRNGEPLKDTDGKGNAVDATLKNAIISALEAPLETDRNEQPIEKYKRSKLADKIYEGDEVELDAENIALIKDRIGKTFNAYVVKYCWDLLEKKG